MKQILLFLCIIQQGLCALHAQDDQKTKTFGTGDNVNITGEVLPFGNYYSEYYINTDWAFRVENNIRNVGGFGTTYTIRNIPFLAKYKLDQNFSVLLGPKVKMFSIDGRIEDVSLFGTFGVQYDVNESFLMEARFDYNVGEGNSFKTNAPLRNDALFKLGAKYKF
ncbi:hypothetical protein ACFFU1_11130 [Algibacter miyuki]|uniref:Outer membrane protein beta-barrel domain-containing protein n=1 Tax=Algibacter miyuki TaxID=1306933 RepID=A0ABV5H0P1_9FLAO|nr:hypothetical protein [Algibacter miyuki]MDN3664147.1 hypothetical protein [Algibacter miyuki]